MQVAVAGALWWHIQVDATCALLRAGSSELLPQCLGACDEEACAAA